MPCAHAAEIRRSAESNPGHTHFSYNAGRCARYPFADEDSGADEIFMKEIGDVCCCGGSIRGHFRTARLIGCEKLERVFMSGREAQMNYSLLGSLMKLEA
jgi:hypothetical protein